MAALNVNSLSLGQETGTERNIFLGQRELSLKKSRLMHLQQHLRDLKERECLAQQHNMQLVQQFDEAQDTLSEMLASNAVMKSIRMAYEKYLEERAPHWQQWLKWKTQSAQRKRMEEHLRSRLKNREGEQMTKSSAEGPLLSQGLQEKPQKVSTLQENKQKSHLAYNQDPSSHLPRRECSSLTHIQSQTARSPITEPCQSLNSSFNLPPSYLLSSSFPHFDQHDATSAQHPPWQRQNPPDWALPQSNHPWFLTTGATEIPSTSEALWDELDMEESPHDKAVKARRALTSKREKGGRSMSDNLSQELDINPVRLSSGHSHSSEGGRDSGHENREKRKKKTLLRERTSSAMGVTGDRSSQSNASSAEHCSSGKKRTRRSGGLVLGSPRMEKMANERTRYEGGDSESPTEENQSSGEGSGNETGESMGEDEGNQSPDQKSDSGTDEEPESVRITIAHGGIKTETQGRCSSAKQSGAEGNNIDEEKNRNKHGGSNGDGKKGKSSPRNEVREEKHMKDRVSVRHITTDDEEETGVEDDSEDQAHDRGRLETEDGEGSAFSQDEEVDEDASESDESGEERESDEEEDGEGEEAEPDSKEAEEEESDSDDGIIAPHEDRPKKLHIIHEEVAENDDDDDDDDETGSKTGSSVEFSEDDIEKLLAPQELTNKAAKDVKVDQKPKASCDYVEIFRVKQDSPTKTDHQSDSDEFDHFYD